MSETVHSGSGGGPSEAAGSRAESTPAAGLSARGMLALKRVGLGVVIALVVIWIAIKASKDVSQFVTVTLNGLSLSALYFVVASGFTLIFGLMRVVNMAHGSLYLLGGYLALKFQEKLFQKDDGGLHLS